MIPQEGNVMRDFFILDLLEEGVYRLSLSNQAWISLFGRGDMLSSDSVGILYPEQDPIGYAIQEDCPEVKKMLEFKLISPDFGYTPYTFRISDSEQEYINMMIFQVEEE